MSKPSRTRICLLMFLGFIGAAPAFAGVFSLPHFLNPGQFSVGLEPELTLTSGAGLGANVKYTHGLNEFTNAIGVIGTSSAPRKFRIGGQLVFDFFPDVEGQPGIGLGTSGIYYRLADAGLFEVTGIPYIHKTFVSGGNEIEPFFAIPLGIAFRDGQYQGVSTVAVGSMFKSNPNFRYILEFGIAVNNTDSYISGGIVYFH